MNRLKRTGGPESSQGNYDDMAKRMIFAPLSKSAEAPASLREHYGCYEKGKSHGIRHDRARPVGTNMVRRLRGAGHQCVVYDLETKAVDVLVKEGAVGARSLEDFADKLKKPRAVWMMVPAAVVDTTLKTLIPLLDRDDERPPRERRRCRLSELGHSQSVGV